jgi:nitrite reductase/ring-hydroxylating ferredoxin subunit/uncharacterized membrane protein
MNKIHSETLLERFPQLDDIGYKFSRWIHNGILAGGKPVRQAADLLHGTWLGHPLHSVMTDVTIGAWLMGLIIDWLNLGRDSKGAHQAADQLTLLGVASAVPTALAGAADYSTVPRKAIKTGLVHALLNTSALLLNIFSMFARKSGGRGLGVGLSTVSMAIMLVSAWLGGELSYRYQIGVNKVARPKGPKTWQPVMGEGNLPERTLVRVDVEDNPVLLYREGPGIYAVGAVCPHEGGPLEEGQLIGSCVECPWHQSVYDLRDGSLVHGPSTYPLPRYEARSNAGMIEVRFEDR